MDLVVDEADTGAVCGATVLPQQVMAKGNERRLMRQAVER
jgi:hypothetical protein